MWTWVMVFVVLSISNVFHSVRQWDRIVTTYFDLTGSILSQVVDAAFCGIFHQGYWHMKGRRKWLLWYREFKWKTVWRSHNECWEHTHYIFQIQVLFLFSVKTKDGGSSSCGMCQSVKKRCDPLWLKLEQYEK